jgi:hypothetical protein
MNLFKKIKIKTSFVKKLSCVYSYPFFIAYFVSFTYILIKYRTLSNLTTLDCYLPICFYTFLDV